MIDKNRMLDVNGDYHQPNIEIVIESNERSTPYFNIYGWGKAVNGLAELTVRIDGAEMLAAVHCMKVASTEKTWPVVVYVEPVRRDVWSDTDRAKMYADPYVGIKIIDHATGKVIPYSYLQWSKRIDSVLPPSILIGVDIWPVEVFTYKYFDMGPRRLAAEVRKQYPLELTQRLLGTCGLKLV